MVLLALLVLTAAHGNSCARLSSLLPLIYVKHLPPLPNASQLLLLTPKV